MDVTIRTVTQADAAELAEILTVDRAALRDFEPVRSDDYFTEAGQRRDIAAHLDAHEQRTLLPCVIMADGQLAGRVNVFHIVYRAFCSGTLGYWVRQDLNGRGVATAAVAAIVTEAFGPWAVHRLEAGTLVGNHGSRRVLARNGFVEIGLAPRYLQIAGRWQDHILHRRLNEAD